MKNKYYFEDDYIVLLCNGHGKIHKVIIDIEDLEIIKLQLTWRVTFNKGRYESVQCHGKQVNLKRDKSVLMHRLITDCPKGLVVDHINGDILNNRKNNLRVCTQLLNSKNRNTMSRNNKTGYRNIYLERGKYRVRVFINNKLKNFGNYVTLDKALSELKKVIFKNNLLRHTLKINGDDEK